MNRLDFLKSIAFLTGLATAPQLLAENTPVNTPEIKKAFGNLRGHKRVDMSDIDDIQHQIAVLKQFLTKDKIKFVIRDNTIELHDYCNKHYNSSVAYKVFKSKWDLRNFMRQAGLISINIYPNDITKSEVENIIAQQFGSSLIDDVVWDNVVNTITVHVSNGIIYNHSQREFKGEPIRSKFFNYSDNWSNELI